MSVGNEAFEPGRTRAVLDASGRVDVLSEHPELHRIVGELQDIVDEQGRGEIIL